MNVLAHMQGLKPSYELYPLKDNLKSFRGYFYMVEGIFCPRFHFLKKKTLRIKFDLHNVKQCK